MTINKFIEERLKDGKLDLRDYVVSNELMYYLPFVIKEAIKSYHVTSLSLRGSNLRWHAIEVAKELAKSKKLTTLDLSGNNLGEYAPEVVQELAKSKKLTTLDLSNNNLVNFGYWEEDKIKLPFLQFFIASSLNIKPSCKLNAIKTAKELAKFNALRFINLSNNFLTKAGIEIAQELAKSKILRNVVLSCNHLRNDVIEIARIFEAAKTFECLDLSLNNLNNELRQELEKFSIAIIYDKRLELTQENQKRKQNDD